MSAGSPRLSRLLAGAGGIALITSMFLPWADIQGETLTGWELWTMADIFLLLAGAAGIGVAITGGDFGLFRPDVSLRGAADLLNVVATLLLAWLVLFDFPHDAGYEAGPFVALASAWTIACAAADWTVLRGAPLFPSTKDRSR